MAEYQEVMKQAKRMCESYGMGCGQCKLHEKYGLCPLCAQSDYHVPMDWCLKNMPEIERIVMDWAAAHPEPRYPTWEEWQTENFPDANRMICMTCFLNCEVCKQFGSCNECRKQPIPADIAEKLGIKPIGGSQ